MKNIPPISEGGLSNAWVNWFSNADRSLSGWNRTLTATAEINFPSALSQTRIGVTMTVSKARVGDVVLLSPSTGASGLLYSADVTANDTITVYAHNYSAASIDPAVTTFRVIVFQN